MFSSKYGKRTGAQNVVLYFSSGSSTVDQTSTLPTALEVRIRLDAYIIVFGAASDTATHELTNIASSSTNQTLFLTSYFSQLPTILQPVVNAVTGGKSS